MIGNDIIDLKRVSDSTHTRRQRFLNKICTASEQEFLLKQHDVNGWIWLFWSMKESAWKAHYRNSPIRLFSPKLLECKPQKFSNKNGFFSGLVTVEGKRYQTFSIWEDDVIYTTTSANGLSIDREFFEMQSEYPESQSVQVKNRVCHTIANHLGFSLSAVKIENNNYGVPQVLVNGVNSKIQLSISHHGRFGAYFICYEHNKND